MDVIGFDLSLTATGYSTIRGDGVLKTKLTGMARLDHLRKQLLVTIEQDGAQLVVIEGYSFGSMHSHAHALGELGGVIRLSLYAYGVPYVDVPPATLKKFATGKGNATKDVVLAAAIRHGYTGSDNNEADAWWLRQMGLYGHGCSQVADTAYRAETAAKIDWMII